MYRPGVAARSGSCTTLKDGSVLEKGVGGWGSNGGQVGLAGVLGLMGQGGRNGLGIR